VICVCDVAQLYTLMSCLPYPLGFAHGLRFRDKLLRITEMDLKVSQSYRYGYTYTDIDLTYARTLTHTYTIYIY
jgi:hypothetical protein